MKKRRNMSIFPSVEEVKNSTSSEVKSIDTVNPAFDYENKKIILKDGKVTFYTGKEKVQQWIKLLIRTEVEKYKVYVGTEFGLADFYNLLGHQLFSSSYGISEMKAELQEKIEAKEEVSSVENITITYKYNKLYIELTVVVDEETLEMEVAA
jgi:hypothetical protein